MTNLYSKDPEFTLNRHSQELRGVVIRPNDIADDNFHTVSPVINDGPVDILLKYESHSGAKWEGLPIATHGLHSPIRVVKLYHKIWEASPTKAFGEIGKWIPSCSSHGDYPADAVCVIETRLNSDGDLGDCCPMLCLSGTLWCHN